MGGINIIFIFDLCLIASNRFCHSLSMHAVCRHVVARSLKYKIQIPKHTYIADLYTDITE